MDGQGGFAVGIFAAVDPFGDADNARFDIAGADDPGEMGLPSARGGEVAGQPAHERVDARGWFAAFAHKKKVLLKGVAVKLTWPRHLMGPKRFLGKPKRFGWRKPERSESPSKRRTGMRVWEKNRMELEPLREHRVTGNGYLLAPCMVLWAAVWATREAYEFAMANMAAARGHDFRRV